MHDLGAADCNLVNGVCVWLTAVSLILSFSTVILTVTAENPGNAATRIRALELTRQTHVDVWRKEPGILFQLKEESAVNEPLVFNDGSNKSSQMK